MFPGIRAASGLNWRKATSMHWQTRTVAPKQDASDQGGSGASSEEDGTALPYHHAELLSDETDWRVPWWAPVGSSLNQPRSKGQVIARCLNTMWQPLTIRSGATISKYTEVDIPQVEEGNPFLWTAGSTQTNGAPTHLEEFSKRLKLCRSRPSNEAGRTAEPLCNCFSTGDEDVGRTSEVEHSIPLKEGTRPYWQPSHRLGPEKEAEAERQVRDLLKKGLIEPVELRAPPWYW